jgi:hypothetical protein
VFQHTRAVPPEWAADIDRLNLGENISQLRLSWLAGMPYEPCQRWVLYEILPGHAVGKILEQEQKLGIRDSLTEGLWQALEGPDPRTVGKWIRAPKLAGGRRWVSQSLVSRNAWDLHKETGGLPQLCWIIEGEHGGHTWQFGNFEAGFLIAAGVPPDDVQQLAELWPNPGSQPYADYDQRTFQALAERDLLRQWRSSLAWEDRSDRTQAGLILMGEAAHRREDMMARVMRWMDNQIGDAVSDIPRRLLPQWSQFAQVDGAPDEEQAHTQVVKG